MKAFRLGIAISSLVFVVAITFAQTSSAPVTGLTSNPAYEKNCAKCHGKNATGRHFGGPSLISAKVPSASGDDLRNIIAGGKGHMPKFAGKLTPDEIAALAGEIKALNGK